jgi:hypothetical protein
MTSAMMAQVLWNMEGNPAVTGKMPYSDVKTSDWFATAALWANQSGLILGDNGKFYPKGDITRERVVTILYRHAAWKGEDVSDSRDLSAFPDRNGVSSWAVDAMKWAVASGIITGNDGKIDPQGNATRAQIAKMFKMYKNR